MRSSRVVASPGWVLTEPVRFGRTGNCRDGETVLSHTIPDGSADQDQHRNPDLMRSRFILSAVALVAVSMPVSAVTPEVRAILKSANAERLARIGQHLMIGADSIDGMKVLVENRAVMGIFITDHNVKGKTSAQIRAKIDALQDIRLKQGLPPLIVAADQEGGPVSRLSPPLPLTPSLATILQPPPATEKVAAVVKASKTPVTPAVAAANTSDANSTPVDTEDDKRARVEAFAKAQGENLSALGVNLNFSPVVDLRVPIKLRNDGETMLERRAISADPDVVTKAAGWYCASLMSQRIGCTLKHFPGLGRISVDTHRRMATLTAAKSVLLSQDWLPYKGLMKNAGTITMQGHVRMTSVDDTTPASFSAPVIDGLIRKEWAYDGVLITDDFSMGAVLRSPGGAGQAAVRALNAGVDIVLVSWSERHLAGILKALLATEAGGKFDAAKLAASKTRIAKVVTDLTGVPAAGQ